MVIIFFILAIFIEYKISFLMRSDHFAHNGCPEKIFLYFYPKIKTYLFCCSLKKPSRMNEKALKLFNLLVLKFKN